MTGSTPEALDFKTQATYGVRVALRGHGTFSAAVKAVYDSLRHQAEGGRPAEVSDTFASAEVMGIATGGAPYSAWREDFL
jgi:2-methylisocitrate lyase-like PEP mutase family enzyme